MNTKIVTGIKLLELKNSFIKTVKLYIFLPVVVRNYLDFLHRFRFHGDFRDALDAHRARHYDVTFAALVLTVEIPVQDEQIVAQITARNAGQLRVRNVVLHFVGFGIEQKRGGFRHR